MLVKLVALNARYLHTCPGILAVREELRARLPGIRLELAQCTINDPYYRLLIRISAGGPDAIFFSVAVWNAALVTSLAQDLAAALPSCAIVLGGPEISSRERAGDPLARFVWVQGEVEGLGEAFYQDLAAGTLAPLYQAKEPARFPCPYRDEDLAGPLRERAVYYEASRGCPFGCSYCLSSRKPRVREKDLALVRVELSRLLAARPRNLRFVDRTFNLDPRRTLAIWQHLLRHGDPETVCHFEISADLITGDMLAFLATVPAGRFRFEIGIQSAHPPALAAVRRPWHPERLTAVVPALVALDTVHVHADLILGLPHETAESYAQGFDFVFRLAPHHLQMGLLKVLPGTPLANEAERFGLVFSRRPPYPLLANRWLDHESLADLFWLGETVEAFCNNRFFCRFWDWLRRSDDSPFTFLSHLADRCRKTGFFAQPPTQERLSGLLAASIDERPERPLLVEILRHDWLACGHRFLPDHLGGSRLLAEARETLRRLLPQSWPGLYAHHEREELLKRSTFCWLGRESLAAVGLQAEGGRYLGFLPERAGGVHGHQRRLLLPAGLGAAPVCRQDQDAE
ncbi:MAG: DUF4080 domain-containing protein [Thermodesulfobacteriota bacterium]